MRKDEIMQLSATWMKLDKAMQSDVSQNSEYKETKQGIRHQWEKLRQDQLNSDPRVLIYMKGLAEVMAETLDNVGRILALC